MSLQPPSQPAILPTELWESVFLHLAPEQILNLRAVNRRFRDVIDGSQEVQYLIDLYAAGLEVGHQDPSLTLADRRKQLDRYRSHWDSLQWVEHRSLPIPFYKKRVVEGGVICHILHAAAFDDPTTDYRFIQLPSVLRDIPLKEWTVHGLPNSAQTISLLPEEDLLVVCSLMNRGQSYTIQLLRMSDGQPHPNASVPIINGPDYRLQWTVDEIQVRLTCSRLAVTAPIFIKSSPPRVPHLIVWDWKTGVKHVDILRRTQSVQFVDEYRLFGASEDMPPWSRWSITLMDTSAPVEDPHKPMEVEFELNHAGSLACIHLTEGTYTQGARLGSPFRTDRKRHVLSVRASYPSQSFVIDYGSICAIASENEAASCIPWNLWKHKTTPLDRDIEHTMALEFVGPRVLEIRKKAYQGPSLRSFDFTPGACRFTKQIDTSLDDVSRYALRRAKLTDVFPEGRMVWWYFSEDNVLAFTELSAEKPQILELWTF